MSPGLPTLDVLQVGSSLPPLDSIPAADAARTWLANLSARISAHDVPGTLALFLADALSPAYWRDILALTWDFRTFAGADRIAQFLEDRVVSAASGFRDVDLTPGTARVESPYPDLVWICAEFTFTTDVGRCEGVVRLVPVPTHSEPSGPNDIDGVEWKAVTVCTRLKELKAFPESKRDYMPLHGKWLEKRRREIEFEDEEPKVIIIGAGQSGLDVAARLKALDVPSLIIEQNARIGDQWRRRYEALCLHDPVWYDHMPYLPFPASWPVYTPAQKLADWLEAYAHTMELNVWTSSKVLKTSLDEKTQKWTVTVQRADGKERTFVVEHVVFAIGFSGVVPNMPNIQRKDTFRGQILHSTQHRSGRDHIGKKVVVVGACTSGHDIAADYYENGVDVTLYQRAPSYIMSNKEGMPRLLGGLYWEAPLPIEQADLLNASFPMPFLKEIHKRVARDIADADKELLDGLHRVGFRTHLGPDDAGFLQMVFERGGGYYLDVGACQLVVDGKIKLKSGSEIETFTEEGLRFADGSELEADVVLFATGFGDARTAIAGISGKDVADRVTPIWGLNEEGELRGVAKEIGLPGLWYMMGNLAHCRFHSLHLALQIKAKLEGVYGTQYSARN